MKNRNLAYFEIALIVISSIAFSYIISSSTPEDEKNLLFDFVSFTLDKIKTPLIPLASASGVNGCCALSKTGVVCGTPISSDQCDSSANFAAGASCASSLFCKKGCCYIEDEGIYDKGVLQEFCSNDWAADEFCNLPGAATGCCVLGENTRFETQGQCKVHTEVFALSEDFNIDWRVGLNEVECVLLAGEQRTGACIMNNMSCKYGTEADCMGLGGEFHEDLLCTSTELNTTCKMTEKTRCVDGKDGVYFIDSCDNIANIYDSSRAKDPEYWNKVFTKEDSCSDPKGSQNSKTCGNCNRFEGGICGAAKPDDFKVTLGDYYCKNTACTYKDYWGEKHYYKNGESWCVYESPISEGDDVPGSRHFRYICNAGTVQVEPCADYRNEICVVRPTMESEASKVTGNTQFSNAVCRKNNAKHCLEIGEGSMKACRDEPDCMVRSVKMGGSFDFDICLPMYPEGFSFEPKYQATGSKVCAINTRTCVVTFQAVMFACVCIDNCGCLNRGSFDQQMDEVCESLGDCQGSKNIPNYYNSRPIKGQVADFDSRVQKYLDAAGLSYDSYLGVGSSLFDDSAFAGSLFADEINSNKKPKEPTTSSMTPAQLGGLFAALGGLLAALGGILASTMMMIAGMAMSLLGAILAMLSPPICPPIFVDYNCNLWEPSGGGDCNSCNGNPDIPCTSYRCNSLGLGCDFINQGTTNELCVAAADDGSFPVVTKILTIEEIIAAENLYEFPELLEFIQDVKFKTIKEGYMEITNPNGGCLDAYSAVPISFNTQEPSQCKFDMEWNNEGKKDFADMNFFVGDSAYVYNHSTFFQLPDPSHGEAQGYVGIHPQMTLYIKCKDRFAHMMPDYLEMGMCVNEGPDETAPRLITAYPKTESYISYDKDTFNFSMITLELAECSWAYENIPYEQMQNSLTCNDSWASPSSIFGYLCTTNLPINKTSGSTQNHFYIKCKDQPWLTGANASNRNANIEPFEFIYYRPDYKIAIDSIKPSGELVTTSDKMTVSFQVKTSGGGENHSCSYSFSGYDTMIKFYETGYRGTHVQEFDLSANKYTVKVRCSDETGDFADGETSFSVLQKSSSPVISRVWQSSGNIYFITPQEASCVYGEEDCRYDFDDGGAVSGDGITHRITALKGKVYYVKCKDDLGNVPSTCSIVLGVA